MLKKVEILFKSFQEKQTPKDRFEPRSFQMDSAHNEHSATVGINNCETKDNIQQT
jgi:hypothetical protein